MRQEIRNKNNRIIGWLDDRGSMIQATHISKGYVGFYNKSSNLTIAKSGSIYCFGDGVQCLIRDAERNLL